MGLNDELAKIRQAANWIRTQPSETEYYRAAMNHLVYVAQNNESPSIRDAAQAALDDCVARFR